MVRHLLRNAIEAAGTEGKVTVSLRNQDNQFVIEVRDNGPGIIPEAQDKVFIPFYTTKDGGSGIGLSLSRQIMRQHQGTLNVKSEVGVGTEFFMRF